MHTIGVLGAVSIFSHRSGVRGRLAADERTELVTPVSHGLSFATRPTVNRCDAAIAEWAAEYNPIAIETSLIEPVRRGPGGKRVATLFVKIDYLRKGGVEPRSATVACTVEADGQVSVAML